jgi:hypothetical protein
MKEAFNAVVLFFLLALLLVFGGGVYVGTKYTDNRIGLDSLQKKVDSLNDENFVTGVELGRWEMTMEWYREANPKEARKLEEWRSHNTE